MKKILGIVAEYNPLHNGHIYHIEEAKKRSKADCTIAVISGNFTQRGEASIVSKWEKAKMAINAGVDIVVELPTIYSISSAENFAQGAVKILNQMGTTHISFGMETSDASGLEKIADVLYEEPEELSEMVKAKIKEGISYPQARQEAVCKYMNDEKYAKILGKPNNILAIEYIKAIKKFDANIVPVGIQRKNVMHNSNTIENNITSSTNLRKIIEQGENEKIKNTIPKASYEILMENIKNGTCVKNMKSFEKIIIYKLRTMTLEEIADLPEVSEGLEYLIAKSAGETNLLCELIQKIKSKRYTYTKIQRILLYALIGITKQDMQMARNIIPYIRFLGLSQNGKRFIGDMNIEDKAISSVKNFENINTNPNYARLLEIDKHATDIYSIAFMGNSYANLDYSTRIITELLQKY